RGRHRRGREGRPRARSSSSRSREDQDFLSWVSPPLGAASGAAGVVAGVVVAAGADAAVLRQKADAVKSAAVVMLPSSLPATLVFSSRFETVRMRRMFASSARNDPTWW